MRRTGVPCLARRLPALVLVAVGMATGCAAADRDELGDGETRRAASEAEVGETLRYECDDGDTVLATYPTDSTVIVQYHGRSLNLRRAASASGARYLGDGFEWWTRGRGVGAEGTLSRMGSVSDGAPGAGSDSAGSDSEDAAGELLETCRKSSAMRPGSAPQA